MPLELGDKRITPVAKADSTDECPRGGAKVLGRGRGRGQRVSPYKGTYKGTSLAGNYTFSNICRRDQVSKVQFLL